MLVCYQGVHVVCVRVGVIREALPGWVLREVCVIREALPGCACCVCQGGCYKRGITRVGVTRGVCYKRGIARVCMLCVSGWVL